jgi:endonuclease YncB( thermonuclease family)
LLDQFLGYLVEAARWLLILLLTLLHPEDYSPWTGTVVQIVRPDEIQVKKNDDQIVNVRIYGVDCPLPESGQFYGKQAFAYTSDRIKGKVVLVQPLPGRIEGEWYKPEMKSVDKLQWEKSKKRYDRIIALVYVDDESFGKDLLITGMAWWYQPFVPFERGYKHLEDEARQAKVGLWGYPGPVPPWKFQGTPIVDGRAQTRDWVHFWVRKDASGDEVVRSETNVDGNGAQQPSQPLTAGQEKSPADHGATNQPPPGMAPQVPPDSPAVSTDTSRAGGESSPEAAPPSPATKPKPIVACHRLLKDLETMTKKEPLSLLQLRERLDAPYRECKRGTDNIDCFRCTVIGHRTDSVEVIEKDGKISAFHYGTCGCPD